MSDDRRRGAGEITFLSFVPASPRGMAIPPVKQTELSSNRYLGTFLIFRWALLTNDLVLAVGRRLKDRVYKARAALLVILQNKQFCKDVPT